MESIFSLSPPLSPITQQEASHWSSALTPFGHQKTEAKPLFKGTPFYLSSNENWSFEIFNTIEKLDPTVDGNTLFCMGGLENLRFFVSDPQIEYLINGDPNPDQRLLWSLFFYAIQSTDRPNDTIQTLLSMFKSWASDDSSQNRLLNLFRLTQFFRGKDSPFLVDSGYSKIREAVKKGDIQNVSLDLNDLPKIEAFRKALPSSIRFKLLYFSHLNNDRSLGSLLNAINLLASPTEGKNVQILLCSPHTSDTCTCIKRSLTITSTNLFTRAPETSCDRSIRHLTVLLDRLAYDLVFCINARFFTLFDPNISSFKNHVLEPRLNRPSFTLFSRHLNYLTEAYPQQFTQVTELFDLVYTGVPPLLLSEEIDSEIFLNKLKKLFPGQGLLLMETPEITPQASYLIEQVFEQIQSDMVKALYTPPHAVTSSV